MTVSTPQLDVDVAVGEDVAVLGPWSVAPSAQFTSLAELGRAVMAGVRSPV